MPLFSCARLPLAAFCLSAVILLAAPLSFAASSADALVLAQYQVLEVTPSDGAEERAESPEAVEASDGSADMAAGESEAEPYGWTLTRAGEAVSMSGAVPSDGFRRFMALRAGGALTDDTTIREDAPQSFGTNALAALAALNQLEEGRAGLDRQGWFLEGTLRADLSEADMIAILESHGTNPSDWRIALTEGETPAAQPDESAENDSATGPVESELEEGAEDPDPSQQQSNEAEAEQPGTSTSEPAEIGEEEAASAAPNPQALPDAAAEPATGTGADSSAENPAQEALAAQGEPDPIEVETPPSTDPAYSFRATKGSGGTVKLTGSAPASVLQDILAAEGLSVQWDRFTTNPRAPEGFGAAVIAGLNALELLERGQVVLRDGQWLLSGTAPIDRVSNQAIAILNREAPDIEWQTRISAPAAIDVCREQVAAYMADKSILFPSAGTAPTQASLEVLPGLVELLEICPDAPLYVEGHTDADGSADANLTLSIRRAEAVVDALIDLGVDPARLYAIGYGSSLPIAPNTTAEGKRQNRRIVFSFEDRAQPAP